MSSTVTEERSPLRMRIRRAQNRRAYWVSRLKQAETGEQAFTDMLRWARSNLAKMAEQRPEDAEAAYWHISRELAALNAGLPAAKYPMRAGITAEEEAALLGRTGGRQ